MYIWYHLFLYFVTPANVEQVIYTLCNIRYIIGGIKLQVSTFVQNNAFSMNEKQGDQPLWRKQSGQNEKSKN